ncbi:hypothetical protein GCM10014713_33040 [Streptomyces purpureus]|uniref:Uncharacterized protein n=1 Tax=Streptomyces purpureus TaxID=1951 RepID=A0A918H4G7_9ACTN|nr:hypothetical protein GCM10014713_33040 [Streptomyces purpureus]
MVKRRRQVPPAVKVEKTFAFPPCLCSRCTAGWCHFHKGPSGTAAMVDEHRRACAPCREQRGLAPLHEARARD